MSCRGGAVGVVSWWCDCVVLLLFFHFKQERVQVARPSIVGRMEIPRQAQYPHMLINVLNDSACERRVIVTLFIHCSSVFNISFRLNPSFAFLFLVVQTSCPWFKILWRHETRARRSHFYGDIKHVPVVQHFMET